MTTRRLCPITAAAIGVALAGTATPTDADDFLPRTVELRHDDQANGQPVPLPAIKVWRQQLINMGFQPGRCGVNPHTGTIAVDVYTSEQLSTVTSAGFAMVQQHLHEPLAGGLRTDPGYFDPGEIISLLNQTESDHPTITRVFSVGTTTEGRTVMAIEISNQPGIDEDEPAIQFNGAHHAREVATPHVVVDVIETLTDNYGVDSTITEWVDSYKTVCVPMVNPDGVQYVFDVFSMWRKNRMDYGGSCIGVDLNRNYPYLWGPGCGSSSICTSNVYRGPSSASELETAAMISLADQFHFTMATSYHSFGQFIDYPYACADGSPETLMPEHDVIDEMMNGVADAIDAVDSTPRYDVFSPVPLGGVNGDDTSWYYAHQGTYAFIIEVGTDFEPDFSEVAGIVNRNRDGWQYMYDRLGQARIDVHVTDGCNNLPLVADVTLTDFTFDTGEFPRKTYPPFGRWTFVTVANDTYTVRASRPGYITQEVMVPVANQPVSVNITLPRESPPPEIYGDGDCDGDVDLADYEMIAPCLAGPDGGASPVCETFDNDLDGDVDLLDLRELQQTFTGAQ